MSLRDKVNTAGRWTLGSYLPKEVQKRIARENGEDADFYIMGTLMADMLGGLALGVAGTLTGAAPLAAVGMGLVCNGLVDACRMFGLMTDESLWHSAAWGHPLLTIPYHTVVKPSQKLAGYLGEKLSDDDKETLELYVKSPRKFRKRFESLDGDEQESVLSRIIVSEKRNKKSDDWLADNYQEGIRNLLYIERRKEKVKEGLELKKKQEPDEMEELWKELAGK